MANRLLLAADYQAENDPAAELAEKREAAITAAVKAGLLSLVTALKTVPLSHAFSQASLLSAIGSRSVSDALLTAYKPVADTFIDAAEGETKTALQSLVVYDPTYAAGQIAGAQQTFIGAIQGQAANVVRAQLLDAIRRGANPEEAAKALQSVIGLNARQAQAVTNFRRLLQTGDRTALTRALRDKRFDRTLLQAVNSKTALTEEQIDAMVERYAARSLAYRAATIARDESMAASTGGIRDAYVQAVQTGRLYASEVTRRWQLVFDERLCPICASIPLLNPQGVGVLQPYMSIQGPIWAPQVHTNCRCSERYKADLSRLSASPFARAA